jgi:hypothetical protein
VNGYAERNDIFVCLNGVDALLCLRLPITQFPSGIVFFFLSFHSRRSHMISLTTFFLDYMTKHQFWTATSLYDLNVLFVKCAFPAQMRQLCL